VDFSWYNINRSVRIATQRDIDFGDAHFPAGTTIDSRFDTDTIKLTYTYSFYRAPEIETAFSIGAHITRLKASLQSTNLGIRESQSTTAPLPVFGFHLDYVLSPERMVRSKYMLFFLDRSDKYTGSLTDFTLAVEHCTFKHVGFGLGVNRSSLDIKVNQGRLSAGFNSVLNGFMLYAVVR
jgi:hypothetical protein